MVQILPSLLAADFARLGEEIRLVESAGVEMLHVDIMDGHFVPNLTLGPPVTESLRKVTKLKLDHHLMIEDPDTYAPVFIKAGATSVSVHYEACRHLNRTLHLIQEEGALAGVVINPATTTALLEDVLGIVDYVLVMSVNPGFGGQRFIQHSLEKVRQLYRYRQERNLRFAIEIDGGVSAHNLADVVRAGVDWVVAGTSVFGTPDPIAAVQELQQIAAEAELVRV
ncbi:MAG: ribulose-phosphate 3-epimerase [Bryobacteraceae bacterium]